MGDYIFVIFIYLILPADDKRDPAPFDIRNFYQFFGKDSSISTGWLLMPVDNVPCPRIYVQAPYIVQANNVGCICI